EQRTPLTEVSENLIHGQGNFFPRPSVCARQATHKRLCAARSSGTGPKEITEADHVEIFPSSPLLSMQ
ncbi:hypothetical protein HAX54_014336, partial [Datura stramonium]|nr:hypothetical protein [Datura stramonium]